MPILDVLKRTSTAFNRAFIAVVLAFVYLALFGISKVLLRLAKKPASTGSFWRTADAKPIDYTSAY